MNSKQRRRQKKFVIKMSNEFLDVLSQMVEDIEQGNTTIEIVKRDIKELKQLLKG